MRRVGPGRFLVTAAAAGAAVAAAVVPASASPGAAASWKTSLQVAGPNFPAFTAVTAVSGSSAWAFDAVGSKPPGAYQLSGSTWTKRAFPARGGDFVTWASASSASNVWAFTFKGQVLRFNGSSWSAVKKFAKQIGSGVAISSTDVWVFGSPGAGTWHFNGHGWTKSSSGKGLAGASALSANSIWAYGGTSVAHWNGKTWTRTNLASLLPKNTQLSHSFLAGIYAASAGQVWVAASGGRQDEGGPLVLLAFNGHTWSRIAENKKLGGPVAIIPDGHGGLWLPVHTGFPGNGSMEHFAHGALTSVTLPFSPRHLLLQAAAIGSHTTAALTVGFTRKSFSAKTTTAVVLRFGS
jgi:hypothetical protein